MTNVAPTELFEQQWRTYRSVIDHNWMQHREVTATCAAALESWLTEHPDRHGQARLLDLGCGDLAQMAPVFQGLPLGSFTGVDLTEQVLPRARAALGPVPFAADFHHADVSTYVEAGDEPFDLVHTAFVLHHLAEDAKAAFLSALRRRIRPDGAFVWADVFCPDGESRPDYLARYTSRIRRDWDGIDVDAREAIVAHINAHDFPADRGSIASVAHRAGWRWQWLWQGKHQAEAVALLTPLIAESSA